MFMAWLGKECNKVGFQWGSAWLILVSMKHKELNTSQGDSDPHLVPDASSVLALGPPIQPHTLLSTKSWIFLICSIFSMSRPCLLLPTCCIMRVNITWVLFQLCSFLVFSLAETCASLNLTVLFFISITTRFGPINILSFIQKLRIQYNFPYFHTLVIDFNISI